MLTFFITLAKVGAQGVDTIMSSVVLRLDRGTHPKTQSQMDSRLRGNDGTTKTEYRQQHTNDRELRATRLPLP
jgi:hypothetical protein